MAKQNDITIKHLGTGEKRYWALWIWGRHLTRYEGKCYTGAYQRRALLRSMWELSSQCVKAINVVWNNGFRRIFGGFWRESVKLLQFYHKTLPAALAEGSRADCIQICSPGVQVSSRICTCIPYRRALSGGRCRGSSATSCQFIHLRHWLSTAPDCLPSVTEAAFPVAATRVWNSLPDLVTFAPSVAVLRSRLKTHLFNISYPSPSWL